MNRINQRMKEDKKLLSIYFTSGYPEINTMPNNYWGLKPPHE